jgi:hypothetical protein
MRIVTVVDGQAEFRSLPHLFRRIESSHQLLNPLYADLQPHAPIQRIVRTIGKKIPILQRKGDAALVLIDRESRTECPAELAAQLSAGLAPVCQGSSLQSITVIVKDRTYENWLISDPDTLVALRGRFRVTKKARTSVEPNRADNMDAIPLLKTFVVGQPYDKVRDAVRVMRVADVKKMARNSRSFRRLMRVIGHPSYIDQSRRPASGRR